MDNELLLAKLRIPRPRASFVARPRLLARLDQALPRDGQWQRALTLISAPAGYGKTTLVTQWLAENNHPSTWLALDEHDNDPSRFLTYLIAALQTIETDVGNQILDFLQSAAVNAPAPPAPERSLTALLNDLETIETPSILVLDDYHLIENRHVHEAVAFLLENLPPRLHLVLASRADPPLPVARLRGQGQLTEIHAADLSFLTAEAGAFFNEAMALGLKAEQVAALVKRTEGWIAGLQLAGLALQRTTRNHQLREISTFIEDFSGSHRFVLDYLTEEVLGRQKPEIRNFLLQTAVLERLCAPLCDALTGRHDSQRFLESLSAANLFVIPLDDTRYWYRYHHLFAELLRQRLQREQPDLVRTLHRRAGAWFESAGWLNDAVHHALLADQFERAASLIEQNGWTVLMRGEMNTLLRWLAALPDEIVTGQPSLGILRAWALAFSGQWDAADQALRSVESHAPPGQVTAVRAYAAAVEGDIERTSELAGEALAHLSEQEYFLRALVTYCRAITYFSSGRPVPAGRALAEVIRLGRLAEQKHLVITATAHLGHVYEMQGRLRQALTTHREALRLAGQAGDRPVLFQGIATVGIAEVLYELNDLEGTLRYAREGIALTKRGGFISYMLVGYAQLLRVYLAQGDNASAQEILQLGIRLAEQHRYRYMEAVFADLQVRQWLAQGNVEAAWRWAGTQERHHNDTTDLALEARQMAVARAKIGRITGNASERKQIAGKVRSLLDPLLAAAEEAGRTISMIRILVLHAVAISLQGDTEQALVVLRRALALAEPEGYVRVFVDEGRSMAALLRQALTRGINAAYVTRLLSAFDTNVTAPTKMAGLAEPLSERELEVLRLIVAGLSNQEIADELFIAVSTVKSHINNIYGKLDVNRRAQAIARSRELNLF